MTKLIIKGWGCRKNEKLELTIQSTILIIWMRKLRLEEMRLLSQHQRADKI